MKSVLMPPMSTNQECNIKKNKAGPSEQSASEQLTKLEWEQVGNQSVHQSGDIISSTGMILSLIKYTLKMTSPL